MAQTFDEVPFCKILIGRLSIASIIFWSAVQAAIGKMQQIACLKFAIYHFDLKSIKTGGRKGKERREKGITVIILTSPTVPLFQRKTQLTDFQCVTRFCYSLLYSLDAEYLLVSPAVWCGRLDSISSDYIGI